MAKKLPWGKFTHEDLRVDHEDDIYLDFPFLKFVGNSMINKIEFRTGDNSVRSFKETKDVKVVGLSASLFNGWDRTSWPIPYVKIETKDHADVINMDQVFQNVKTVYNKKILIIAFSTLQMIEETTDATHIQTYISGLKTILQPTEVKITNWIQTNLVL